MRLAPNTRSLEIWTGQDAREVYLVIDSAACFGNKRISKQLVKIVCGRVDLHP